MKPTYVKHRFVEFVPDELEEAALYISIEYATVVHACLCGCGSRIVTPLSPTDWQMTYDGHTVSLDPSVGNWSFGCQSHYWISRNRVRWAGRLSRDKIEAGRSRDSRDKDRYVGVEPAPTEEPAQRPTRPRPGVVARIGRRLPMGFRGGPAHRP